MASDTVASVAYARLASTMSTTWGQVGQRTKWISGLEYTTTCNVSREQGSAEQSTKSEEQSRAALGVE